MSEADRDEILEQIRAFGSNLRSARLQSGMTQAALSSATAAQLPSAVPLDRAAISRLECGERAPDMPTLLRICAALGVKPAEMLYGIGSTAPAHDSGRRDKQPTNAPAVIFGENLRWARTRAGISQERLALDAKVDRAAISVYENGRREPNLRTIVKIALKLGIQPTVLRDEVAWSTAGTGRRH
jgi:transcriptional regulator with XRE-family HTH domain